MGVREEFDGVEVEVEVEDEVGIEGWRRKISDFVTMMWGTVGRGAKTGWGPKTGCGRVSIIYEDFDGDVRIRHW